MRERLFAYTRTVVCANANGCEKASRSLRKSVSTPPLPFLAPRLLLLLSPRNKIIIIVQTSTYIDSSSYISTCSCCCCYSI